MTTKSKIEYFEARIKSSAPCDNKTSKKLNRNMNTNIGTKDTKNNKYDEVTLVNIINDYTKIADKLNTAMNADEDLYQREKTKIVDMIESYISDLGKFKDRMDTIYAKIRRASNSGPTTPPDLRSGPTTPPDLRSGPTTPSDTRSDTRVEHSCGTSVTVNDSKYDFKSDLNMECKYRDDTNANTTNSFDESTANSTDEILSLNDQLKGWTRFIAVLYDASGGGSNGNEMKPLSASQVVSIISVLDDEQRRVLIREMKAHVEKYEDNKLFKAYNTAYSD